MFFDILTLTFSIFSFLFSPGNEKRLREFDALSEKRNFLVLDAADDVGKVAPEDDESVEKRRMGSDDQNRSGARISLKLKHFHF